MRGLQLTLTVDDFNLLLDYLSNGELSEFNRSKLYQELKDCRIVNKECLPLNVVCRNAKVVVWNMDKRHTYTVTIVMPEAADVKENKIAITDPVAIALLGYATGAVTEWEMPSGVNRLKIISVSQLDADSVCL